jgi:hypothetical protein
MFTTIALVLTAALVLAVFIRLKKQNDTLKHLKQTQLNIRRKLEYLEETFGQEVAALNYEFQKQSDTLRFAGDMTFKEALAANPRVEEVMIAMHVGGCPDCAVSLDETLAHGAAKNSVDVEEFLIALNNLPAHDTNGQPEKPAQSHPKLNILP